VAADGSTLLLAASPNAFNATLYDRFNFNFIRDIAPVAGIMVVPDLMVVHPSVLAKTVPEFIAFAKANPGKVDMASAGIGSASHVSGELFRMMTGVNLVHVPYRGNGPALADLLAAQVRVMFPTMPSSIAYIRAGKLRPLAVTTTPNISALAQGPPRAATIGQRSTNCAVMLRVDAQRPSQLATGGRTIGPRAAQWST